MQSFSQVLFLRMNKYIVSAILSILLNTMSAQTANDINIIPQPSSVERTKGVFNLNAKTKIFIVSGADTVLDATVQMLVQSIHPSGKIAIQRVDLKKANRTNNAIVFLLQPSAISNQQSEAKKLKADSSTLKADNKEAYSINTTQDRVIVSANGEAGIFYACQSLLQMSPVSVFNDAAPKLPFSLPCSIITDEPRFDYRGMHLDVSRHFFSAKFVKRYIDLMAMHKFNTFHWHLTDDQGWRIEIKKYPLLTSVGSKRKETMEGNYQKKPRTFDAIPYGGFYTQDEIRDVVQYAQKKFITIIPEIEMPGHALAALSAYPNLSCDTSKKYEAATMWGVFEDVFCPKEETFDFIDGVITEVAALFPSEYIHIGGDECPKTAWKKSEFCQDLMKREGLKNEEELQSYFIRRVEKILTAKGKKLLGWDEILEGGLSPNATVMSWRGIKGGIEAAKLGHEVVMTPGSPVYFDHYQAESSTEPMTIGGLNTLQHVYDYEPLPKELTEEQQKLILGAQGNVWTEYITDPSRVEYMVYPRACALSEVVWSQSDEKNYQDFTRRLSTHIQRLANKNVNFCSRAFDVELGLGAFSNTQDSIQITLTSALEGSKIYYTTDKSAPSAKSILYIAPFSIGNETTVRAIGIKDGVVYGLPLRQKLKVHTAIAKKYTLTFPPDDIQHTKNGVQALTDGKVGTEENMTEWLGFRKNDFELVFDFGKPRNFSGVSLSFLNQPDKYIFTPVYVSVSTSNDGIKWQEINRSDMEATREFTPNSRTTTLPIFEQSKPKRFLKILAKNIGTTPPVKGSNNVETQSPAWIYVDEVIVK